VLEFQEGRGLFVASNPTLQRVSERFTIARVLSLSWHAWIACRWHLLLIVVPVAMLRLVGGFHVYAALPRSLARGWKEMISGWITVGFTTPAIACLAYAVVRFAGGQGSRPVDILETPWRRIPVAVVAALIVHTIVEGPELLIPKSSALALAAAFLTYVAYKLGVMTVTFLLLPILVVERRSVASALDRGIDLMAGHRWRIVALTFLIWTTLNLVGLVHPVLIRPWHPALSEEVFFLVRFVRTFLVISITSCIPAMAYCLLCSEKQGATPEGVARVFD
jgi:hypothetical protein